MEDEELLPADEGRIAYQRRQTPDANPYRESDWRHDEWWFGWKTEEECDQDDAYDWSTDSFKTMGNREGAMKFPENLPGGWEFTEPFKPSALAKGQVWRKCGPSDAIEIVRVMQPGHQEFDGGLPGISVRSSRIGDRAVTWCKDTWFMPGTEQQLMKRLESDGYARAK